MELFFIKLTTFLGAAAGSFIILYSLVELPSNKAVKAAMAVSKLCEKASGFDVFMNEVASRIAKILKISQYKRSRLESALKAAGIMMSPEMFKATTILKTGMTLLLLIPSIIIFPISSVIVIVAALIVYFKDENDINVQLAQRREQIEFELPRFVSTLKQELKNSHDVLGILERYALTADESFKKELEVTIADMRSSNYEAALIRLESRVSSGALSDITRGLVGVIRGDNNQSYFEMLSHDLDALEIQRLEDIAARQPEKIKKYHFIIFACIMLVYIATLAAYIYVVITAKGGKA